MKARDIVLGLTVLALIGCVPAPKLADDLNYPGVAKLHRVYVLVDNRVMVGRYGEDAASRKRPPEGTHGWEMAPVFSDLLASEMTGRLTEQGLDVKAGVVKVVQGAWVYANVAPLNTADVAVQAQFREAATFAPDALLIVALTKVLRSNNSTIYEAEYDVSLRSPGDHAPLWRAHTNRVWMNTGNRKVREQAAATFSTAVVDALKRIGAI
jgi:hypothetical protein